MKFLKTTDRIIKSSDFAVKMHREDAVMLHLALTIIPAAMSVLFIVLGALTIAIPEQLSGAGAPDTVTCRKNNALYFLRVSLLRLLIIIAFDSCYQKRTDRLN